MQRALGTKSRPQPLINDLFKVCSRNTRPDFCQYVWTISVSPGPRTAVHVPVLHSTVLRINSIVGTGRVDTRFQNSKIGGGDFRPSSINSIPASGQFQGRPIDSQRAPITYFIYVFMSCLGGCFVYTRVKCTHRTIKLRYHSHHLSGLFWCAMQNTTHCCSGNSYFENRTRTTDADDEKSKSSQQLFHVGAHYLVCRLLQGTASSIEINLLKESVRQTTHCPYLSCSPWIISLCTLVLLRLASS